MAHITNSIVYLIFEIFTIIIFVACIQRSIQAITSGILFSSTQELCIALKKYLAEHAEHFIEAIGRNSWISMFEEKLLPGVSEKI